MNKYDIVYGTEQMIVINMVKHFWYGSYFNFFIFSVKFIVYQFLIFFHLPLLIRHDEGF